MTIEVGGSSGGDVLDSISIGDTSASGSSGVLFNIAAASTKRIIITGLMPATTSQTLIEIKFGTRVVYSGTISDSPLDNTLTVSQNATSTSSEYLGVGTVSELRGDYGEDLTITKTSGSTNAIIYLSHKVVL